MHKDSKHLIRKLRRMGAEISIGGSTHYRVRNPANGVTITIAISPSDFRWKHKVKQDLKRLGFKEV